MRSKFPGLLTVTALLFSAPQAFAEIIEIIPGSTPTPVIIRGAPDRCGETGPVIIKLKGAENMRPVRCARPVRSEAVIGTQVNNFVVVFLADKHKRDYKRAY